MTFYTGKLSVTLTFSFCVSLSGPNSVSMTGKYYIDTVSNNWLRDLTGVFSTYSWFTSAPFVLQLPAIFLLVFQIRALQYLGHQAESPAGRGLFEPWQCLQGARTATGGPR